MKFGADGEIINRAKLFCGEKFRYYPDIISMMCLDLPDGLTNNKTFGITNNGLSEPRKIYLENYKKWHKTLSSDNYSIGFPMSKRPFACHETAEVSLSSIVQNFYNQISGVVN